MKKLILPFAVLFTLFSCQKDSATNTTSSTEDSRSLYIGTWVCEETSQQLGTSIYSVYINPHSSIENRIVIDNFYNLGVPDSPAQVEVNGNQLNLFLQNVHGFDVSGSGTLIHASQINMAFVADDGSGVDNVTLTLTKTN